MTYPDNSNGRDAGSTTPRGARILAASKVIDAALAVAKARKRISPTGSAVNSVWSEIERKENKMLRAVENLAGLKPLSLGERDSE